MRLALVLAGGALGSGARYLVAVWMANRFGSTFPWGTLTVNVAGGFVIGLLATMADEVGSIGPQTRVFLVVGVLGGFTTFSSFTMETLRLADQSELWRAGAYVAASFVLAIAATALGIGAGRSIAR
jgi:CrcB protein